MKHLLTLLVLILFVIPLQAQDSTTIPIGRWNFRMDYIPFGAIIQASHSSNTQLEAIPFVGSGLSLTMTKGNILGFSVSSLFYSDGTSKVYPLFAGGIVIFPQNRVALSLGWDFGKTSGVFDKVWKERLRFLVNYSLNIYMSK